MSPLLSVEGLAVDYGGVHALRDVTLEVEAGAVVAVLGANGAGKSTTLRALAGLVPATARRMEFDGRRIERLSPHARARLGLVLVPEGRMILPDLTVMENLRLGSRISADRDALDRALAFFPALDPLLGRRAGVLSGGEQQMLAIARAIAMSPRLLMIDEMSLGLAPVIVQDLVSRLREIRTTGMTFLIVEQFAPLILPLCDAVYLLERGAVVERRVGEQIGTAEVLESMHLGGGDHARHERWAGNGARRAAECEDTMTVHLPAWALRTLEARKSPGTSAEDLARRLLLKAAGELRDPLMRMER